MVGGGSDEPALSSGEEGRKRQQEEGAEGNDDDDNDDADENQLPLIPNPHSRTLSPRHSRLLGLVLLRGIDTARRELHLLTPLDVEGVVLSAAAAEGAERVRWPRAEDLVLVAGRFDTPTWAYSEWLYRSRAKGPADGSEAESESESDDGEGGTGSDGEGEEEDGQGRRTEEDQAQVVVVVAGNGDGSRGGEEAVPWVEALHGSQKRAAGSKVWRVRRDLGRN